MKCTECNDTRVYYGLGTAPPEPCRACANSIPQRTPEDKAFDFRAIYGGLTGRNNQCYKLATYFAEKGVEKSLARPQIHQWRDHFAKGLPDAEVDQCIDSAYRIEAIHQRTVAQQVHSVTTAKSDGDGITMIDSEGRKFQASIDEWCEALQAKVDKIAEQRRHDEAAKRWATAVRSITHDFAKAKVELTREPTAHEIATRQLPPIRVTVAKATVPKVRDSELVKSDTCPKSEPITDAELQKLIDQAVKSGQNLDALIKERTLAKDGVPPVITLYVTY